MHNLEVALVIISPDLVGMANTRVLVRRLDKKLELPTGLVGDKQSSFDAAARLFETLVNLRVKRNNQGGWVELTQYKLFDEPGRSDNLITIPYGGMVPLDVAKLANASLCWQTLSELVVADQKSTVFGDHMQILQEVVRQL